MHKIKTCLCFDHQAEEAAKFHVSLFPNSRIEKITRYGEAGAQASGQKIGSVMSVEYEVAGSRLMGLNGGPEFKFTPALSQFVWCESALEIETLWKKLSEGGTTRMGLDKYPFAERYGWIADRYGVDWQLILLTLPSPQKIAPAFLFVDKLFGRGEEALQFYLSKFQNSKIESIVRDESSKSVMHCVFSLEGQRFVLMEGKGSHNFGFSMATSLVVTCQNQAEIDSFWSGLSEGASTSQCGWLTDKFGVAWQITPAAMTHWVGDPKKSEAVTKKMLTMTKLDLAALEQAFDHG